MSATLDLLSLVIGAAVTIPGSYLAAQWHRRHELEREAGVKRREILERVGLEIAEYMSAPTIFVHSLALYRAVHGNPAERRTLAAEERREQIAKMLSEEWHASTGSREGIAVRVALDELCAAHQRLARAIYWASLTTNRSLGDALDEYWSAANDAYLVFRRQFIVIEGPTVHRLMTTLSHKSEFVRQELGRAYAATFC